MNPTTQINLLMSQNNFNTFNSFNNNILLSKDMQQFQQFFLNQMVQQRTMKKRVCFSNNIEMIQNPIDCLTLEDISQIWWNREELALFKVASKNFSRELRKGGDGISSKDTTYPLVMAQKKTSLMMNSDFKSLLKLTLKRPDEDLQSWCVSNDGRRGLERFICKENAIRQRNGIIKIRRSVFAMQQKLRTENSSWNVEKLAESSRVVSRRTRTLAHYMGSADAHAAHSLCYEQRPCKMRKVTHNNNITSRVDASTKRRQEASCAA